MIKNIKKKFITFCLGLGLAASVNAFSNPLTIYAEETETEEATTEAAKDDAGANEVTNHDVTDSVVQVVLIYKDDKANNHIIQSGSGIVVDSKTVITNRKLTLLTDKKKEELGAYFSEKMGKQISFADNVNAEGVEKATYSLAIVETADIFNEASVSLSSKDWNFAILSLSSSINKQKAVLGNSDLIDTGKKVSVVGYPNSTYDKPISYQTSDLSTTSGECVNLDDGKINFDARLEAGNSGGPLVDEYGRVVGITTYSKSKEGRYKALPINQVKSYLERSGVAYVEDVVDYSAKPVEDDTTEEKIISDKSELDRTIQEAQLIYDEGNSDGKYTSESFRELNLYLGYAKETFDNEAARQPDIDADTANLRAAIDGLKEVEKTNVALIILIILCSLIVAAGLTVLIIFLIKKSKKKGNAKKAQQQIKTIGNNNGASGDYLGQYQNNVPAMNNMPNVGLPSSQLYAKFNEKKNEPKSENNQYNNNQYNNNNTNWETTVLRTDVGTTILSSAMQYVTNAYLYSKTMGESVGITGDEFIIGKAPQGTNYRIDNNTNVSRMHAKIIRNGNDYYIEDLNSTNFTFVNRIRVTPGCKQILQNNDVIHLADEEFVFLINA